MLKTCVDKVLCGERTIIGIRNFVSCENPESRLFLNDYPGLTFKDATKLANDEMQTGYEVMKKSIEQAFKLTFDDLMDFTRERFNFNAIAETRQLENFSTTTTVKADLERGLVLKRWRSEMAKIEVEEIYIRPAQAATVNVLIYDGDIIKTFEDVVLEANKTNVVRLNYVADSEKIRIVFNQKDTDVYKCNFTKLNGWDSCGCSRQADGFMITGWDGTQEKDNCFGMGVLAHIRCYEETIFCAMIPRLYTALWYRSVVEFLKYRINSDRVNNLTTFGKEKAEEMLAEAWALYVEKYERVIKNSDTFFRSLKGDCLTCNTMRYVQTTP